MRGRDGDASPHLIHCSYHKCLTVYFGRVMRAVCNRCTPWRGRYRHYRSEVGRFYEGLAGDRVASVNNHAVDLARVEPFRLTRFLRDPRDLVVSGYFYHRRGAEAWTARPAPTGAEWSVVNGVIPDGMRASGLSFAAYLQSLPEEDGLLAELEFRRRHFESMAAWPRRHAHIVTFRYEDVVVDPVAAFEALVAFYGWSPVERWLTRCWARHYRVGASGGDRHVRDPRPGQWRARFTPEVRRRFDARYAALIRQLGYPAS